VAERAGLENRRWGNPSASSNLAPSAIFPEQFVLFRMELFPEFPVLDRNWWEISHCGLFFQPFCKVRLTYDGIPPINRFCLMTG
jgi:hypothetical protein